MKGGKWTDSSFMAPEVCPNRSQESREACKEEEHVATKRREGFCDPPLRSSRGLRRRKDRTPFFHFQRDYKYSLGDGDNPSIRTRLQLGGVSDSTVSMARGSVSYKRELPLLLPKHRNGTNSGGF